MKKILKHKWAKHSVWVGIVLVFCITLTTIIVTTHIQNFSRPFIFSEISPKMPNCFTVMVLGASVHKNGDLSPILLDRINSAVELYKLGKVKRFLLSGDHGRIDYDEVNTMKNHLIRMGIDSADIFLDHAGFDTYSSMVRAKEVFKVDSLYIVTQNYHLYRAVYIARQCGLEAYGYVADRRNYVGIIKYTIREWFANMKSWVWVNTNHKPVYLGEQIPITGESRKSWDVK